jgi:hypothetical protein
MKLLYSIPVFLMATILSSLLTFSTSHELVYGQQQPNQTGTIDISQELKMNLTLGKPLYTEKFIVPKSVNDNSTSPAFSFLGSGILNGMNITAAGNGHAVPRGDGTISVTNGRALFTSDNGVASYSFEEILNMEDNVARHLGAAFFDANATGNLEFLKSVVGVYKSLIDEDGRGTFAMWQLE